MCTEWHVQAAFYRRKRGWIPTSLEHSDKVEQLRDPEVAHPHLTLGLEAQQACYSKSTQGSGDGRKREPLHLFYSVFTQSAFQFRESAATPSVPLLEAITSVQLMTG